MGWVVLHSLWQGTMLAALLALFLRFGWRLSPEHRYAAAAGSMMAWLLMAIATLCWVWPEEASGLIMIEPEASRNLDPISSWPLSTATVSWWQRPLRLLESHTLWIGIAWSIGCFLVATRWMGGQWYIQRIRGRYASPAPEAWVQKMQDLAEAMNLRRHVRLLECSKVYAPMVVGSLKPAILLPLGLLTSIDPRQIEAILAHELAHLRRWDDVLHVFLSFMESLWFFHPAFWWIAGYMKQERELACDDMAVRTCGDPMMYARTLVHLEGRRGPIPAAALAMVEQEGPLFQRIKRLMMPHSNVPFTWPRFLPAGMAIAALLIIGWVSPSEIPAKKLAEDATLSSSYPITLPSALGSNGSSFFPSAVQQSSSMSDSPLINHESGYSEEKLPSSDTRSFSERMIQRLTTMTWESLFASPDSPRVPAPAPPAPPESPAPRIPGVAPTPPTPPIMNHSAPPAPPAPTAPVYPEVWSEETAAQFEVEMENFEREMEAWSGEMETWGQEMEAWGAEMEAWGESFAEEFAEGFQPDQSELNRGLRQAEEMQQRTVEMQQRLEEMQVRTQEQARRAQETQVHGQRLQGTANDVHMSLRWHTGPDVASTNRTRQNALKRSLKNELVQDGFMKASDSRIKIKTNDNDLKINGRNIDGYNYQKYLGILSQIGVRLCEGCSNTVTLQVE